MCARVSRFQKGIAGCVHVRSMSRASASLVSTFLDTLLPLTLSQYRAENQFVALYNVPVRREIPRGALLQISNAAVVLPLVDA